MIETPDDQPSFVAEEPEHCHACYRLALPAGSRFLRAPSSLPSQAVLDRELPEIRC
jgi:hypothetical protein